MLRLADQIALTFDDVLLVPRKSTVLPKQVSLKGSLGRLPLHIPVLSAAMDTVTEARMAIAMAQEGGIGVLHKNITIAEQAQAVKLIKKFESGVVMQPMTISPDATLADLQALVEEHQVSSLLVIKGVELQGIVTHRDWRTISDTTRAVHTFMTPKHKLVTVEEGAGIEHAVKVMHKHRIEKIPVVNTAGEVLGLYTLKDTKKAHDWPDAAKDPAGHLLAAAAVGVGAAGQDRVQALVDAGVDIVVIDTAHGHSEGVLQQAQWVKQQFPEKILIVGNIATAEAALALADIGVDAVKVGIGPGSICTTRIISGVGVPQLTAIANIAEALQQHRVGVIADGGIRYSGDIAKAIAAGADCVMVGSILAGTDESPGDVELFQGRSYKSYRGMGSLGAMVRAEGARDRYFQSDVSHADKLVPEGVEGRVPYKGSMHHVLYQLLGGLRSAMGYLGCADIASLQREATFVQVSAASNHEGHVHDVEVVKEAPNYQMERF